MQNGPSLSESSAGGTSGRVGGSVEIGRESAAGVAGVEVPRESSSAEMGPGLEKGELQEGLKGSGLGNPGSSIGWGLGQYLESVTSYFAVAAAMVYVTGFLIESAFLDRFGVTGAGVDFLKAKYLQVGLLFILFPCGLVAPVFVFFHLRKHPSTAIPMPTMAIVGIGNALLVCYWLAVFSLPGRFYQKGGWIMLLFGWVVLTAICSRRFVTGVPSRIQTVEYIGRRWIDPMFARAGYRQRHRAALVRGTVIAGLLLLDLFITDFFRLKWTSIKHSAFYFFFCFLAALYAARQHKDFPDRYRGQVPASAWFFILCILCTLYYMAIQGFAYGVYPHIPVAKGGGDYMRSPDVELYWKPDCLPALPSNVVAVVTNVWGGQSNVVVKSIRLRVLEETPSTLWVADPRDNGGPEQWSLWRTPHVVSLHRDLIVSTINCAGVKDGGKSSGGQTITPAAPAGVNQPSLGATNTTR